MVGCRQVIVDRLRHADYAQFNACRTGGMRDLEGRVRGIIAADVHQRSDVLCSTHPGHLFRVASAKLIATRPKRRRRRVLQSIERRIVDLGQIDDEPCEPALHPVTHPERV